MKITLQPSEEYFAVVGTGKTFGAAAKELIDNLIHEYAVESLDDGLIFEALGNLQEEKVIKHFDVGTPEQSFEMTLEE